MKNKFINFGLIALLAISYILYNGFQTNKITNINDSETTTNNDSTQDSETANNNPTKIFEKVVPSVFAIYFDYNTEKPLVNGTGFSINYNNETLIVTNAHVVPLKNEKYHLVSKGNKVYTAKVVYSNKEDDIAFLRIKKSNQISFLNIKKEVNGLHIGQQVFTIGNPFDLLFSFGGGMITNINNNIEFDNGDTDELLIQTDINVNPGNSGGPLLNSEGEVIGIISSTLEESIGISFAIPSYLILEHLDILFKS